MHYVALLTGARIQIVLTLRWGAFSTLPSKVNQWPFKLQCGPGMQQVVSVRSKAETLKLFRDGKLAHRETPLGGCTAVESCDLTPLEPIPWDCLAKDCANAVVFGKRLSLLIKTQETVVATLEKDECGSVEHRLEMDHLRVLLKARQRLTETV
jgi:hypothetical protein